MSNESWPQPLKDWVAKCLVQMTDSNRAEAQTELKNIINEAFVAKTLWTTDWEAIQLQSLRKPTFNLNNLKRKTDYASPAKKTKKQKHSTQTTETNDQAALDRRAQRFQREHQLAQQKASGSKTPNHYLFNSNHNSRSASPFLGGNADESMADPNVIDWDHLTIVGTSQEIFKDYLRLTSDPKPETIRPYAVLRQTLVELKKRWREKTSYSWICNQFKSLRQDLTVQRIKNEFTVEVYEQHARMALEHGDMVQYNQCQDMLKGLYELGIPGKVEEFTAYRILLLLHGRNTSELNLYVGQLTPKQKKDRAIAHALDVQRSLASGNYHKLFDLYLNAPNMGAYIMDHFVDRERMKALMIMTKAYRTLSLTLIHDVLAFDSLEEARNFLVSHSLSFFSNPNSPDKEKVLECKPMFPQLQQVYQEKYRKVGIHGAI